MAIFYTDSGSFNNLEVTGSTILSGSLIVSGATNFGPSGLTGSLFGTASNATSASFATTASFALNGGGASTPAFPFSGDGVITGSLFISQSISGTPALRATGSIDFVTGSTRLYTTVNEMNLTAGDGLGSDANISLSSIGTAIVVISAGDATVEISSTGVLPTGINRQLGDPSEGDDSRWSLWSSGINNSGEIITTAITASNARINGSVSASSYTSSLNNQVGYFGTSSWAVSASWAPGGTGNAFPFNGNAIITGSLLVSGSGTTPALQVTGSTQFRGSGSTVFSVSGSLGPLFEVIDSVSGELFTISSASIDIFKIDNQKNVNVSGSLRVNGPTTLSGSLIVSSSNNNSPVIISGSTDSFFELEVVNFSAGNNASSDIVVSSNDTTDSGNYINLGINSTTYNGGLVGGPSDGYLYFTSSVGELHVGNASTGGTSNVRLFAGGPSSDNTTRVFISSSGNIGLGTSTPNERLVVAGNQIISGSLTVSGSRAITTTGSLGFLSSSVTINSGSIKIHTGSFSVYDTSGNNLSIRGSTISTDTGTAVPVVIRYAPGDNGVSFDVNIEVKPENDNLGSLGIATRRWSRAAIVQVSASIVSASAGITGSLAQFNPVSLKLTVGTTAPTSPAVNDLWVDTN